MNKFRIKKPRVDYSRGDFGIDQGVHVELDSTNRHYSLALRVFAKTAKGGHHMMLTLDGEEAVKLAEELLRLAGTLDKLPPPQTRWLNWHDVIIREEDGVKVERQYGDNLTAEISAALGGRDVDIHRTLTTGGTIETDGVKWYRRDGTTMPKPKPKSWE